MMDSDVVVMETLGGFPNLPALWLRRAKPACAYAASGRRWPERLHTSRRIAPVRPRAELASG
jgi:hypothetical protein